VFYPDHSITSLNRKRNGALDSSLKYFYMTARTRARPRFTQALFLNKLMNEWMDSLALLHTAEYYRPIFAIQPDLLFPQLPK
jgi:hypothetical protein